MIHTITVKNFRSIADQTTLSFIVNDKAPTSAGFVRTPLDNRVSLVHAVIGGNASGKTSILKALALVQWFTTQSFRFNPDHTLPVKGFAGSETTLTEPTEITVTYEFGLSLHEYSLRLTSKKLLSETLYVKTLTSSRITAKKAFSRTWNEKTDSYDLDDRYLGLKEPYWSSKELSDTSLLLAAVRFGNERAKELVEFWKKLQTNIDVEDRYLPYQFQAYHALRGYTKDANLKEKAEADIRLYDLGIRSFGESSTIMHGNGKDVFELEIDEESSGTQQFIVLKEMIDQVLTSGGVAVIDELNAFLHPMMSEAIIRKFLDPNINTGNGQLFFSTHDLRVFDILNKYQISLTEKDKRGVTSIRRFDSQPRLRPTDNYIKKYLAGVYGGVNRFNF